MKRRALAAGLVALALAVPARSQAGKGTITAASITIKVHKLAVSTSKDCSKPVVVFASEAGIANDLLSSPTYGAGPVAPGTYECVLIELSKVITTSALTTSGSCTQDAVFSDVICGDGQTAQLVDGTPVTCSGGEGNAQHVTLFITTASAGHSGERALLPPSSATDSTSGLQLTAPLVVAADLPVTLKVDPTQFLDGRGATCATSAPSFSVD